MSKKVDLNHIGKDPDDFVINTVQDFVVISTTLLASVVMNSLSMFEARKLLGKLWSDLPEAKRREFVQEVDDLLQRVNLVSAGLHQEFRQISTGDR